MIKVDTLRCTVTVKTKRKQAPTGRTAEAAKPSIDFHKPSSTLAQAGPTPSQTMTEGKDAAQGGSSSAQGADPAKVMDQVYRLIMKEIRDSKWRGEQ